MLVYLVRHGKAEAGGDDTSQRLTDPGRRSVQQIARRLTEAGVRVDRVEHSGLVRARQTAEILVKAVGGDLIARPGLGPNDDVEAAVRRLAGSGDVMLVGHLPFMERMASFLLLGFPDAPLLHFRTSSIACFSQAEGLWVLEWFLAPNLA